MSRWNSKRRIDLLIKIKKGREKKKKTINHENLWEEYCKFMNSNLPKKKKYHESPHIIVRQSLHLIVDNSIILNNPSISQDSSLQRKINYEVEKIGRNVKIWSKNPRYKNVLIDEIAGRRLYVIVNVKLVNNMSGLIFFDEFGTRLETEKITKMKKAFVLLAMVEYSDKMSKSGISISTEDIELGNKLWVNQIKTDGSFHFDTSGKIFGIGYGPKYSIDAKTNLSIGQFAGKRKKISDEDMILQAALKKKIFKFVCHSLTSIYDTFNVLEKNISPNISKLQIHFDLFNEIDENEMTLQRNGILNAHLCLNAQTRMKHTERDSSYTMICVPPHEKESTDSGAHNKAESEFNLSDDEAIVIPLKIGTTLIYSGLMLTHRQQIKKLNDRVKPVVNIVSYNSQKMFNHMMESFRREIKIDSKK